MDKSISSTAFSENSREYNSISNKICGEFPINNCLKLKQDSLDERFSTQYNYMGMYTVNEPFENITKTTASDAVPEFIKMQSRSSGEFPLRKDNTTDEMSTTHQISLLPTDTAEPTVKTINGHVTDVSVISQNIIERNADSESYAMRESSTHDAILGRRENPAKVNQVNSNVDESSEDEDEDEDDEDDDEDEEDDAMSDSSDVSNLSGLSDLSCHNWKPITKPMTWLQDRISCGADPRELLSQILGNSAAISPNINNASIWRMLVNVLSDPPRRQKLQDINTVSDVVRLLRNSKNIIVLTGAGVSVSCGIPDFRSIDGIYSRLSKEFPDLPDPQAMFDIQYFSKDPRPFYKFAKEIYPGQFTPSACHRFIKLLEKKKKLLRNYTQNIDTLERIAGIENVIECHGSFATASCTKCNFKTSADAIRDDIFAQRIPLCPVCHPNEQQSFNTDDNFSHINRQSICYSELVHSGIMKPDIVFFGEGLPDAFHSAMTIDKDNCDLLIVIGSSLKVRPVALIPSSIPADVPQILINREQLCHLQFDVELLGDSDVIINQLCHLLGNDWTEICYDNRILAESNELKTRSPSSSDTDTQSIKTTIQSDDNSISNSGFCDSGFESSSSSNNPIQDKTILSYQLSSEDSQQQNHFGSSSANGISSFFSNKTHTEVSSFQYNNRESTTESTQYCEAKSVLPTSSYHVKEGESKEDRHVDSNGKLTKVYSNNNDNDNDDKRHALINLADRLYESTYFKTSASGVYIFPGAQIYCSLSDSEDNDDVAEEDDENEDEGIEFREERHYKITHDSVQINVEGDYNAQSEPYSYKEKDSTEAAPVQQTAESDIPPFKRRRV